MEDWDSIFPRSASGLLEAAVRMGHQVGEADYQWQLARHFLSWGVPVYLSALSNALGGDQAAALAPGFLDELETAIRERGTADPDFPMTEFLETANHLRSSLGPLPGAGAGEDRHPAGTAPGGAPAEEPVDYKMAEAAHDMVKVALTMGREQFEEEAAGEAMTWILSMGCTAFLNGLAVGMGEESAERLKPSFFSRIRYELREQYEEVEGYPLSHFMEILASIGRRWIRLDSTSPPETG